MEALIVSATETEIEPFLRSGPGLDVLITGVGIPATVYQLTRALTQKPYDFAINAGIAGSFDRRYPPGHVVQVISDGFADLGAEDHTDFLDIFQLGLADKDARPFSDGRLRNPFRVDGLDQAQGITVNTVHGNPVSIEASQSRFQAATESMEGAAFFYVCMLEEVPCLQLRAVSNYVEKRNRASWNIPLAIASLNEALNRVVREIREKGIQ